LFLPLAGFVPSARVQTVSSSFLSGKRKMGLTLPRDPEASTDNTVNNIIVVTYCSCHLL
jgi:hypothetical protein